MTDAEHTREDGRRQSAGSFYNESGQAVGGSTRYGAGLNLGQTVWVYDGSQTVNVGMIDAEHTRAVDGYRNSSILTGYFNQAGQVAGEAQRYGTGYTSLGQSAWLYNGTATTNVGLTDAEHTNSGTGFRFSRIWGMNEAGHVAGDANRYAAGGSGLGRTAWLYNGTATLNIGLTDAEHTRSTDGYRESFLKARFLNDAGQVTGASNRYGAGGAFVGRTAWLFDGSGTLNVGLTDAEHTRSTDGTRISDAQFLNQAGQVAGSANRYDGTGTDIGRTAWLYDGTGTLNIGFTDSEHTRSTDGYRNSSVLFLNESGQVAGTAYRYSAGGTYTGTSSWIYDGSDTLNIGLTDFEHTTGSGTRVSTVSFFNEAGQAAGYASRFSGSSASLGQTAWVYNGSNTLNVGLTAAEYTRITVDPLDQDGFRHSEVGRFNEAGQAAGISYRYSVGGFDSGTALGQSAWLFDGASTADIGLTDGAHTRSTDGYRYSAVQYLNNAGQVAGFSKRYGSNGVDLGQTVWLYDGTLTVVLDPLSQRLDGYAFSLAQYLSEEGDILGYYEAYDGSGALLGNRAFWFSLEYGLHDLSLLVDESFDDWVSLANAVAMTSNGLAILGYGLLADMPSGQMAFVLTSAPVPVPPAMLLLGSALALLAGLRRRAA
jgi:hypothetical protein